MSGITTYSYDSLGHVTEKATPEGRSQGELGQTDEQRSKVRPRGALRTVNVRSASGDEGECHDSRQRRPVIWNRLGSAGAESGIDPEPGRWDYHRFPLRFGLKGES